MTISDDPFKNISRLPSISFFGDVKVIKYKSIVKVGLTNIQESQ